MKIRFILIILILLTSCESTHTYRKIIRNDSSFSFSLRYVRSGMDSIFNIEADSYVYIDNFTKLGNHPCELPSSPCSLIEDDSLLVLIEGYNFNGNFRNEYNWIEDFSGNKHTVQVCAYEITNDDFE